LTPLDLCVFQMSDGPVACRTILVGFLAGQLVLVVHVDILRKVKRLEHNTPWGSCPHVHLNLEAFLERVYYCVSLAEVERVLRTRVLQLRTHGIPLFSDQDVVGVRSYFHHRTGSITPSLLPVPTGVDGRYFFDGSRVLNHKLHWIGLSWARIGRIGGVRVHLQSGCIYRSDWSRVTLEFLLVILKFLLLDHIPVDSQFYIFKYYLILNIRSSVSKDFYSRLVCIKIFDEIIWGCNLNIYLAKVVCYWFVDALSANDYIGIIKCSQLNDSDVLSIALVFPLKTQRNESHFVQVGWFQNWNLLV